MNDDGLQPGAPVDRETYWAIMAQHWLARQMVIRGEQPDIEAALVAVRA